MHLNDYVCYWCRRGALSHFQETVANDRGQILKLVSGLTQFAKAKLLNMT